MGLLSTAKDPTDGQADLAIKIGRLTLTRKRADAVQRVEVTQSLYDLSAVAVEFEAWPGDATRPGFLDEKQLAEGQPVEVQLGRVGALAKLFTGEITGLEAEFVRGEGRVAARAFDLRHRLRQGRRTRAFTMKMDDQIVSELARDHGLSVLATPTGKVLPHVQQANQSDWEFLSARARAVGYVIGIEGKRLRYQKAPRPPARPTRLTPADVLDMYLRRTLIERVDGVIVRGWNAGAGKAFVGKAGKTAGRVGRRKAVVLTLHRPVFDAGEAQRLAVAELRARRQAAVTVEVSCRGRTDLEAGGFVALGGVGKAFDGTYAIRTATHAWTFADGYRTDVTLMPHGGA